MISIPEEYEALGKPEPRGLSKGELQDEWGKWSAAWVNYGFEPRFCEGLGLAQKLVLGDIQFRSWWRGSLCPSPQRFPIAQDEAGRLRHVARPGAVARHREYSDLAELNSSDFPDNEGEREDNAGCLMEEAGVPRRFAEVALGGIACPEKLGAWAASAATGKADWFYIGGGTGAGKTTLAATACLALVRRGVRPRFVNARVLKQLWDGGGLYGTPSRPTKTEAIARYKTAPVLVLDGLGEEATDKGFCQCLFDLIDHRYTELLPTLITSQFGLKEYRDRLLEASGDREGAWAIASRIGGSMGGAAKFESNYLVLGNGDRRTA